MATSSNLLDTDSEDELPAGWQERVAADGRVYFANHSTQSTQWEHPVTGKKKTVAGELPYGWEQKVSDKGTIFYVDHLNHKTTYTDPRLAFAEESGSRGKSSRSKGGRNSEVKQRFDASSTAMQVLLGRDLSGLYAVVTGANSGIGYETARSLALHGAHVVLACRDSGRGAAAVQRIQRERPLARVVHMHLDLACLASVHNFANTYINKNWPIHILILNAGVFGLPHTLTEDGYETTFQTNHLGHFYLTQLLTNTLKKSAPARVVIVSAESHRFTDLNQSTICETILSPPPEVYRPIYSYNQSKLCNILLSQELHRRLAAHGVCCQAVHPGNVISTGLSRHWWFYKMLYTMVRPFAKSKQQAAATVVFCATAKELQNVSGYYFNNCFQCQPSEQSCNTTLAARLWELSEIMVSKAHTLQQQPLDHR